MTTTGTGLPAVSPVLSRRSLSADRTGQLLDNRSPIGTRSRSRRQDNTDNGSPQRVGGSGARALPIDFNAFKAFFAELKSEIKTELTNIRTEIDDRFSILCQGIGNSSPQEERHFSQPDYSPEASPAPVQSFPVTARPPPITDSRRDGAGHQRNTRVLCDKFCGSNSAVPIAEWLLIYETVTIDFNETNDSLAFQDI